VTSDGGAVVQQQFIPRPLDGLTVVFVPLTQPTDIDQRISQLAPQLAIGTRDLGPSRWALCIGDRCGHQAAPTAGLGQT